MNIAITLIPQPLLPREKGSLLEVLLPLREGLKPAAYQKRVRAEMAASLAVDPLVGQLS
jgi:hypothetical protein